MTQQQLDAAARQLQDGGLVVIPTETVYGLAANAQDAAAVTRIFAAKKRPSFDPLDCPRRRPGNGLGLRHSQRIRHKLANAFWPGHCPRWCLPRRRK